MPVAITHDDELEDAETFSLRLALLDEQVLEVRLIPDELTLSILDDDSEYFFVLSVHRRCALCFEHNNTRMDC